MLAIFDRMLVAFSISLLPAGLWGDTAVGYVSWDVTQPGSTGQFDIVNNTGPNASVLPDLSFPIMTSVNLENLTLSVDFSNGSTTNFGSSYFTLGADGLSLIGSPIEIGGTNPQPTQATLTVDFSPLTVTLTDGSAQNIEAAFSATILPSSPPNLSDGDLAVIFAISASGPPPVPEPSTWLLVATGCIGLLASARLERRRRGQRMNLPVRDSDAGVHSSAPN